MLTNIFFYCYMIFLGCAIPVSIGVKHGMKNEKLEWADSVMFIVSREMQLLCFDNNCAPVDESIGVGTSFIIDIQQDKTTLMTAAHLCEPRTTIDEAPLEIMGLFETKFEMAVIHREDMIEVSDIIYFDRETDICIFTVPEMIGRELKISKTDPRYGDGVWSIGAPTGYFPQSAKPITRGLFSGRALRTDKDGNYIEFFNFNMPTIGGMSGSPIINKKGEVVGMVSAVNQDWHLISYSPTLYQILKASIIVEE